MVDASIQEKSPHLRGEAAESRRRGTEADLMGGRQLGPTQNTQSCLRMEASNSESVRGLPSAAWSWRTPRLLGKWRGSG